MKTEIGLCMGCMSEKDYSGPCEKCGYIDNSAYLPDYLPPFTLLNDRYVVGKLLSYNGEGAVYLGYDKAEKKKITIKEYMPAALCDRDRESGNITVKEDCIPLYKSYLSEFADLNKTLMNCFGDSCIRTVYGIFAENNTGYIIMEYLEGLSLSDYLSENGNVMSWAEAEVFFQPVFTALAKLHSMGIIHRGISADTVFVRKNGKAALTGLDISAGRTAESRIDCEMYEGYAACEQYALSERQGSWTDVYGMSALLYRVLTGKVPPSAREREVNDTIVSPVEINGSIPKYISDAIMRGLTPDQLSRTHNIEELAKQLYTKPEEKREAPISEGDGPVSPAMPVRRPSQNAPVRKKPEQPLRRPVNKKSGKGKKESKSNVGLIIGLVLFLAVVIALVVAIVYFSNETANLNKPSQTEASTTPPTHSITTEPEETEPVTEETTSTTKQPAGEIILMPYFINRFFNTSLELRYSMIKFIPEYEYSNDFAEGIIFEQDIEQGTEVTSGVEVKIKVSKGPSGVPLPDYIGMKVSEYTKLLDELKIPYKKVKEETTEVKKNYVVRCDREIGEIISFEAEEGEEVKPVKVYYAVPPEVTTTEETGEEIPEELPGETPWLESGLTENSLTDGN